MAIRIGTVEITMLQRVDTIENRQLVQHNIPGKKGSDFQDLGRKAARLELEGILQGKNALKSLEQLRAAHINASPLPFSSDIAVGSDIVDVIIEDLQARQLAGYESRFVFFMVLAEYVKPAVPSAAALGNVNLGVLGDAKGWADKAMKVLGSLDDPEALVGLLTEDNSLLDSIDMNDLAGGITRNIGNIGGGALAKVMQVVSKIDVKKGFEFITAIKEGKNFGECMGLLAEAGAPALGELLNVAGIEILDERGLEGLAEDLGIDPDFVKKVALLITNGDKVIDFFKQLYELFESGKTLVEEVGSIDFQALFNSLASGNPQLPPNINEITTAAQRMGQDLVDVVTHAVLDLLEVRERLSELTNGIARIIDQIKQALEKAAPYIADIGSLSFVYNIFKPLRNSIGQTITTLTEVIDKSSQLGGAPIAIEAPVTEVLDTAFYYMDNVDSVIGRFPTREQLNGAISWMEKAVEELSTASGSETKSLEASS